MTIESGTVTVDDLHAYLARPTGGSSSGMLLLPMITGIGEQVRAWADELAHAGTTALVWDPWQGRGSSDDQSMDTLATWVRELDDAVAHDEQTRLLDHLLGELGVAKAGVMGWCLGGRFALALAGNDARVANVVAYHPTVPGTPPPNHSADAVALAARIEAPVMILYPSADHLVPAEKFAELQAALQSRARGASIVHFYPGAQHGFSARQRHGEPANAEAFAVSWPQALDLIRVTTTS